MKQVIETIAYADNSNHDYIHVTTTDKLQQGHAYFEDDQLKTGRLHVTSWDGSFTPEEWNFIKDVEPGVYHRDELDVILLPNYTEAEEVAQLT